MYARLFARQEELHGVLAFSLLGQSLGDVTDGTQVNTGDFAIKNVLPMGPAHVAEPNDTEFDIFIH